MGVPFRCPAATPARGRYPLSFSVTRLLRTQKLSQKTPVLVTRLFTTYSEIESKIPVLVTRFFTTYSEIESKKSSASYTLFYYVLRN